MANDKKQSNKYKTSLNSLSFLLRLSTLIEELIHENSSLLS